MLFCVRLKLNLERAENIKVRYVNKSRQETE